MEHKTDMEEKSNHFEIQDGFLLNNDLGRKAQLEVAFIRCMQLHLF
jgi:hypothetical protein